MIRALVDKMLPATVTINKRKQSTFTIFMPEMLALVGKELDFVKLNDTEYRLAQTNYNIPLIKDPALYLLNWHKDWLIKKYNHGGKETIKKVINTNLKDDSAEVSNELNIPNWVYDIIKTGVL